MRSKTRRCVVRENLNGMLLLGTVGMLHFYAVYTSAMIYITAINTYGEVYGILVSILGIVLVLSILKLTLPMCVTGYRRCCSVACTLLTQVKGSYREILRFEGEGIWKPNCDLQQHEEVDEISDDNVQVIWIVPVSSMKVCKVEDPYIQGMKHSLPPNKSIALFLSRKDIERSECGRSLWKIMSRTDTISISDLFCAKNRYFTVKFRSNVSRRSVILRSMCTLSSLNSGIGDLFFQAYVSLYKNCIHGILLDTGMGCEYQGYLSATCNGKIFSSKAISKTSEALFKILLRSSQIVSSIAVDVLVDVLSDRDCFAAVKEFWVRNLPEERKVEIHAIDQMFQLADLLAEYISEVNCGVHEIELNFITFLSALLPNSENFSEEVVSGENPKNVIDTLLLKSNASELYLPACLDRKLGAVLRARLKSIDSDWYMYSVYFNVVGILLDPMVTEDEVKTLCYDTILRQLCLSAFSEIEGLTKTSAYAIMSRIYEENQDAIQPAIRSRGVLHSLHAKHFDVLAEAESGLARLRKMCKPAAIERVRVLELAAYAVLRLYTDAVTAVHEERCLESHTLDSNQIIPTKEPLQARIHLVKEKSSKEEAFRVDNYKCAVSLLATRG